jgi:protein disulfide-isomerase
MMKSVLMTLIATLTLSGGGALFAQDDQGNEQLQQPNVQQAPMESQQTPSKIQWYTNYTQALQAAKQGNKPVLLFFTGSDWCGWCKKMVQEVFSSPDFVQSVGNDFVFVEIDFPMNKQLPPEVAQQNNQLKQENGVTGYPTVIIKRYINNNLTFVAESGYRPGGGKAYADYLKQLLKQ